MTRTMIFMLVLASALSMLGCGERQPTGRAGGGQPRAGDAQRELPVQAYTVARRTLSREVLVAGTVEPLRSIELASRTDGVVAQVMVEAGDRVRVGQLLATIDIREQLAELARAQALLNEARTNFQRLDALRKKDFVDQASVLRARSALDVAESEVDLWRTRIDFGRIEATINGVVIERHIEPGAAIGRLAPAFALADLSQLVLRVGVSELDAVNIAAGTDIPVRIDALADTELRAKVRRVFPAADASSRLVTVELALPDAHEEHGVRPGYLGRARFNIDRREGVIAVPASAVALGSEPYVMLIGAKGALTRRAVRVGVVQGDWREILEGLGEGDAMVASSPVDFADGDMVRVVGERAPL